MNYKENGKKKKNGSDREVEELLQATQDQILLNLSLDSHMTHVFDSDLDRRFQALKSRPSIPSPQKKSATSPSPSPPPPASQHVHVDEELKAVLGHDLSARFAALKGSSSSSNVNEIHVDVAPKLSDGDCDNEEDEIEKLLQWAKDAARLDPSPPSDDDDDSDDDRKTKAHN